MQGLESQATELRPYPEGTGEPQQLTDKSNFASKGPFWLLVGDGLEGEAGRHPPFTLQIPHSLLVPPGSSRLRAFSHVVPLLGMLFPRCLHGPLPSLLYTFTQMSPS